MRSNAHIAVPIPDGLTSESAAPMFCAGISVYNPLRKFTRKSARVGVIGIGGLGHLALQFARAMETEVYAISTNPDKRDESLQFGAYEFVVSTDAEDRSRLAGKLDFILSTATAELDWPAWLSALRPNGTFCLLGASPGPVTLPVLPMIFGQYSFTARVVGSPARIADMLQFAAVGILLHARPSHFRPSFFPADKRSSISRRRFSFVSFLLADSIQPMYARRYEGANCSK